jgi:serine/threonine protein kinase
MERLAPGTRFGSYTVEGLVASGGMGQVYAARHDVYGTAVALKVLHEDLHAEADWRLRFNEEGLVGSRLKHPHVLSARELVEDNGRIALVLDLISGGQTLEKVMAREFATGLTVLQALHVFLPIVQGIEYLHAKQIVHGDVKPENVMIQGDFRAPESWLPLVTDFGTVGLVAHPVTIDGRVAVVATPRYASPEHMHGLDHIENRSDIYCLGLILHYLLTGRHASSARTVKEASEVVCEPYNLTLLVDQPEQVLDLFRKATDPSVEGRFASCRDLALAVRGVLDALGSPLELEDLQADLATEVDEVSRAKAEAARTAAEAARTAVDPDAEETDPGNGTTPSPRNAALDAEARFPPFTDHDDAVPPSAQATVIPRPDPPSFSALAEPKTTGRTVVLVGVLALAAIAALGLVAYG